MEPELKQKLLEDYGGPFTYALERTMAFEGGWSNHPSDRGGKTRYGITQKLLRSFNALSGTWWTVERLTQGQAAQVYHRMFWIKMRIDRLPSAIQGLMFDWSVHAGYFAIRSMQRHIKVKPDGAIGPATLAALDQWTQINGNLTMLRSLAIRRMNHLCRLVRRDRKQGDFLVGWWTRVSHFLK